jgi:hypothetical protein
MGLANPYQCFKLSPEFHFTLSDPQPVYLGEFQPEPEHFRVQLHGQRCCVFQVARNRRPRSRVYVAADAGRNDRHRVQEPHAEGTRGLCGYGVEAREISEPPHQDIYTMEWKRRERRVQTIRCPQKRSISCTPTSTLALPNCREMFSTCHPKSYARYKSSSAWTGVAGTPP